MADTALTAAGATKLVKRAREAGISEGTIIDTLDVTGRVIEWWSKNPDSVPGKSAQAGLRALADKLDRAERRKGAR